MNELDEKKIKLAHLEENRLKAKKMEKFTLVAQFSKEINDLKNEINSDEIRSNK